MISTRKLYTRAWPITGLLFMSGVVAVAQTQTQPPPPDPDYPGTGPAVDTNVYGGGGGWGGGYHSSTAAGSYLQGMGSAISAQGQKNLNDSMAARNYASARSAHIDNQNKHVESYRWRDDSAKQRQEQQIAEMKKKSEPWLAKQRLQTLTPQEYNPATGMVGWPMLCRDPTYKEYRDQLDQLMAKRAQYGALTMEEFEQTEKLIKDWRMAITSDSKTKGYPADVVRQSLRFLLSLNKDLNEQFG